MKLLCGRLLVGITGSISATSMLDSLAFLRRALVERIDVIMTASATRMVGCGAVAAYAGTTPYTDTFEPRDGVNVPHIALARTADLMLIMPASANIIAKAAHGIADDLLSTTILACPAPVVFVPCMNGQMWFSRPVQANIARLREHGYHVIDPVAGFEVADVQATHGAMPALDKVIGFLAEVMAGRATA